MSNAMSGERVIVANSIVTVAGEVDVTNPLGEALAIEGLAGGEPVTVAGPVTDTQLRAAPVEVDITNTTVTVDGPLTDGELRATPVPVSGPLTNTQLRAEAVKVQNDTLPLDVQLTGDSSTRVYTDTADRVDVRTATNEPLNVAGQTAFAATAGAGATSSPANNAVLQDTGQLAAGDYEVHAIVGVTATAETTNGCVDLVVRDATNTADVMTLAQVVVPTAGSAHPVCLPRVAIAANQRIVWRKRSAATSGAWYYSHIAWRRVA